jgi:hypothetical protein
VEKNAFEDNMNSLTDIDAETIIAVRAFIQKGANHYDLAGVVFKEYVYKG